jgi:adenosine kinase
LQDRGIATTYIQKLRKHVTATAIVCTDAAERQITFFHPGADAAGAWPDLQSERAGLTFGIVSPRDVRMMADACNWCQSAQVPYLFDPGQQVMQFGDDELQRAIHGSTGVICNAYEWELFSQKTGFSIDGLLKEIKILIISHGEDGVTLYTAKEALPLPACRAEKVLNPTGAGDALRAGILTGLGAGWSLRQAGQLGASLASFVVEQEGALIDTIDSAAVVSRAETTYGETLPALP